MVARSRNKTSPHDNSTVRPVPSKANQSDGGNARASMSALDHAVKVGAAMAKKDELNFKKKGSVSSKAESSKAKTRDSTSRARSRSRNARSRSRKRSVGPSPKQRNDHSLEQRDGCSSEHRDSISQNLSPKRRDNSSPERRRIRSPERQRYSSFERRNNRSLERHENRSLERRESRSLERRESRSLEPREDRSLERRKNRSLERRESRSMERRENRSLERRENRSLERRSNRSLERSDRRSPERRSDLKPKRWFNPMPGRRGASLEGGDHPKAKVTPFDNRYFCEEVPAPGEKSRDRDVRSSFESPKSSRKNRRQYSISEYDDAVEEGSVEVIAVASSGGRLKAGVLVPKEANGKANHLSSPFEDAHHSRNMEQNSSMESSFFTEISSIPESLPMGLKNNNSVPCPTARRKPLYLEKDSSFYQECVNLSFSNSIVASESESTTMTSGLSSRGTEKSMNRSRLLSSFGNGSQREILEEVLEERSTSGDSCSRSNVYLFDGRQLYSF